MDLLFMSKKGDKLISVYWFFILFIVAAGIVYMVFSFYGQPYDVRSEEVKILAIQISDCFSEGGLLKDNIYFEGKFILDNSNFLEKCNLNFNVEDFSNWKEQEQYYVEVNVENFEKQNLLNLVTGNFNLKDFCGKDGENFPFCYENYFYTLDKDGNKYFVKILSVVKKTEKNVN